MLSVAIDSKIIACLLCIILKAAFAMQRRDLVDGKGKVLSQCHDFASCRALNNLEVVVVDSVEVIMTPKLLAVQPPICPSSKPPDLRSGTVDARREHRCTTTSSLSLASHRSGSIVA